MSDYCKRCIDDGTGVYLCPKHRKIDELIEALRQVRAQCMLVPPIVALSWERYARNLRNLRSNVIAIVNEALEENDESFSQDE